MSVGEYHSFGVDLHSVGDEGVDIHAGGQGVALYGDVNRSALRDVAAHLLVAVQVIDAKERLGHLVGKHAADHGARAERIGAVLRQTRHYRTVARRRFMIFVL